MYRAIHSFFKGRILIIDDLYPPMLHILHSINFIYFCLCCFLWSCFQLVKLLAQTLDFVLQLLNVGDSIYNNCSSIHLKQKLKFIIKCNPTINAIICKLNHETEYWINYKIKKDQVRKYICDDRVYRPQHQKPCTEFLPPSPFNLKVLWFVHSCVIIIVPLPTHPLPATNIFSSKSKLFHSKT